MDILGIGPLELFFILIIALIVLGPNDMVKAGRTLGRFMRSVVTSETWHTIRQASNDIRNMPNRLMREAGIEEEELKRELDIATTIREEVDPESVRKEIAEINAGIADWTTPPDTNTIAPPQAKASTGSGNDEAALDEWVPAPLPEDSASANEAASGQDELPASKTDNENEQD